MSQKSTRAFSLVEMAVGLVIVGILAGVVLTGQDIIRAANMHSVITDYQRFTVATQSFSNKYDTLPGDMANATRLWGAADANPVTCGTTASTDKKTCDGNQDGLIQGLANGSNESYRFWQHLANAGLIDGKYDGITHGATAFSSTRANSPEGKVSDSIWFVWAWNAPLSGDAVWFDGEYGNRFSVGGALPNSEPMGKVFTAANAHSIDTKLDDGKPGRGKVRTPWNDPNCVNSEGGTITSASLNASYNLQSTFQACYIMFPEAF